MTNDLLGETDAYGAIIVCGDYEGDVNAIADALNRLDWNDDYFPFIASEDGEPEYVVLSGYGVKYPTVYPFRYIYVFKDGRRIPSDEADESAVEEWEEERKNENGDLDTERYSLKELSDLISPHLTKGTIELVAVAYDEGHRYAYCDRLVIRSDGSAERQNYEPDACTRTSWSNLGIEHYDPKAEKPAVNGTRC
jgi:hypothetical protein